jgi:hypothetical protein
MNLVKAAFLFVSIAALFTVVAGVQCTAPASVATVFSSAQKLTAKNRYLMAHVLLLKLKQAARCKLQNRGATSAKESLSSTGFRVTLLACPLSS